MVGRAGLRHITLDNEVITELSYVVLPDYWHQGLATEMALVSLAVAFELMDLNIVYAKTSVTNQASIRVMSKVGMKFCRYITDHTEVLYAITKDQWFEQLSSNPPLSSTLITIES